MLQIGVFIFSDFLVIFGCKRVNCDVMDGDRTRLPANKNCYRLSRVSWALAQISCCSYCMFLHFHWRSPNSLCKTTMCNCGWWDRRLT